MPSVTLLANVRAGINGLMAEVLEDPSGLAAASFSIMFVADAGATSSRSASSPRLTVCFSPPLKWKSALR
jgi:hypothetical protein